MAVLSPALVVAMCVMFILTRLHRHYYIFEHPFLFGLMYCLEPDRNQLAEIAKASSSGKGQQTSQHGKKKGKQPASSKASSSSVKPKISVSSLVVRRVKLSELFFSSEAEFPHHRELDHLMTICTGYVAAYFFEDITNCLFPKLLLNMRSLYVAIFGIGFATVQSWKISVTLTSSRIMFVLAGAAWLVALCILSAGDYTNFIKFDQAFESLRKAAFSLLTNRLWVDETSANIYCQRLALFSRFLVATVAAFVSASTAVPARRFSKLDYLLHAQYRRDESTVGDDPYSLTTPTAFTILKIALDYVIPLLTVFLWCVSPRHENSYGAWRIMSIFACVIIRFVAMRIRLQAYLDGAINAYRNFWKEKTTYNAVEAGRRMTFQVIGTSFYLIMITMAYVAPMLTPFMFAFMAKLDGGVTFGIGMCQDNGETISASVKPFFREISGFLAWWCIASYVCFALASLFVEAVLDFVNAGTRDYDAKIPVPTTSSEKRRQKRDLQDRIMKNRLVKREEKT